MGQIQVQRRANELRRTQWDVDDVVLEELRRADPMDAAAVAYHLGRIEPELRARQRDEIAVWLVASGLVATRIGRHEIAAALHAARHPSGELIAASLCQTNGSTCLCVALTRTILARFPAARAVRQEVLDRARTSMATPSG